jgi:hypothetical protein
LEAHDAVDRERVVLEIEELLRDLAGHVDGQLGQVCEAGLLIQGLVDRRRSPRPAEPWQPTWQAAGAYDCVLDAVRHAIGSLEGPYARHGRTLSRNSHPLTRVIENLTQCWSTGRGSEPREAA